MVDRFSTTFKLPPSPLIDCDLDFNKVLSLEKNNNNNSRGFFFFRPFPSLAYYFQSSELFILFH